MSETKKTTHRVDVVPLNLSPCPNSDFLSVCAVDGWQCVTQTAQWAGKDRAAFVLPDTLVPVSRPEFAFLAKDANADGYYRIRAKKLRGVRSFGLLVPAPDGAEIGQDVSDLLGCKHYDPAIAGSRPKGGLFMGGEVAPAPDIFTVKYDLEPGRKYAQKVFTPGEPCLVTEKLHGANSRYVYSKGEMHCGSRTEWKKEYPSYDHVTVEYLVEKGKTPEEAEDIIARLKTKPKTRNMWWQALDATPSLRAMCEANPGMVVYGEAYGAVQNLNYGCKKGEVKFAAFDLMKDGRWLDAGEALEILRFWDVPTVPILGEAVPFDFDALCEMAEGRSTVPGAGHVREGIVARPLKERTDHCCGRVVLKFVGVGYLEKSVDEEVNCEDLAEV